MGKCRLYKNDTGSGYRAVTASGARSTLFDKIAGIPSISDEDAVSVYTSLFSDGYKKSNGDWERNIPKNSKAVSAVSRAIKNYNPELVDKAVKLANTMDNPIVVYSSDISSIGRIPGKSVYTTQGIYGEPFIMEDLDGDIFDLSKVGVNDNMEQSNEALRNTPSMQTVIIDRDGSKKIVVNNAMHVTSMNELSSSSTFADSFFYESGEPRLFYVGDDNIAYSSYREALINNNEGYIRVGTLNGIIGDDTSMADGQDLTKIDNTYKINNDKAFTSLYSTHVDSNVYTKNGLVNYMIRKDLLSDTKVVGTDGSYHYTGAGSQAVRRIFNSAQAYERMSIYAGRDVTMDENGHISFKNKDSNIDITDKNGKSIKRSSADIYNDLMNGRGNDMMNKYMEFPAVAAKVLVENGNIYDGVMYSISSEKDEQENTTSRVVDELINMGVDEVSLSDYVERYGLTHEKPLNASSLINTIRNISEAALTNDKTVLTKEAIGMLVSENVNDETLDARAESIRSSDAFKKYNEQAYDRLSKIYKGDELEREVVRQVYTDAAYDSAQGNVHETFLGNDIENSLYTASDIYSKDAMKPINKMASDIDMNDDNNGVMNDMPMYSIAAEDMFDKLQNIRKHIDSRAKTYAKLQDNAELVNQRDIFVSEMNSRNAEKDKIITDDYETNNLEGAITAVIGMAEGEANLLERKAKGLQAKKTDKLKGGPDLKARADVSREIKDLAMQLKSVITQNGELSNKNKFINRIDAAVLSMDSSIGVIDNIIEENNGSTLEKIMDQMYLNEDNKRLVRGEILKVQNDISTLFQWFGRLADTGSYILKLLSSLIHANNMKARQNAAHELMSFLSDVQESGWNTAKWEKLIQEGSDGKKGGFLISPYNFTEYYRNLRKQQIVSVMEALKDLNQETYNRYMMDQDKFIEDALIKGVTLRIRENGTSTDDMTNIENTNIKIGGKIKSVVKAAPAMKDSYRLFRANDDGMNVSGLDTDQRAIYDKNMNDWHEQNDERMYTKEFYDKANEIDANYDKNKNIYAALSLYLHNGYNTGLEHKIANDFDGTMEEIISNGLKIYTEDSMGYPINILNANGEINYEDTKEAQKLEHAVQSYANSAKDSISIINKNRRMNRARYRKEYYDKDGNFDYIKFIGSSDYVEYQTSEKVYKENMSDIDNAGSYKTGMQAFIAYGMRQMQSDWRKFFESSGDRVASSEFIDTIQKIENEQGKDAAMRYLVASGRFGIDNDFWTNDDDKGIDAMYELYKDYEFDTSNLAAAEMLINTIHLKRAYLRKLLSTNRDTSTPGNIMDSIGSTDKRNIVKTNNDIISAQIKLRTLMGALAKQDEDFSEQYKEMEYEDDLKTETSFNEYFINRLKDETGKSLEEVDVDELWSFLGGEDGDRMTASKMEALKKTWSHLLSVLQETENKKISISPSELKAIYNVLGISPSLYTSNKEEYLREFRNRFTSSREKDFVITLAGKCVNPYYRRTTPRGFSDMMRMIRQNDQSFSLTELVKSKINGQDYRQGDFGDDSTYMPDLYKNLTISGANDWYDGTSGMDKMSNPRYEGNVDNGRYQPNIDLYKDQEYFKKFGIDPNDIHGEATINKEEWDMLKQLKELNKNIAAHYKIVGDMNLYKLPQISRSSMDRISGAATNPSSIVDIVKNWAADNMMNRVDDPLYGQTDNEDINNISGNNYVIPKYYVHSLESESDITHDLGYSFAVMNLLANEYEQKSNSLEDYANLKNMLLSQKFAGGKPVESTKTYKMFMDYMNYNLYGVKMNSKMEANIGGYTFDITKIITAFAKFVEKMDLMFSPIVGLKGVTSNFTSQLFENLVGQHLDKNSSAWAAMEAARLGKDYVGQIGNVSRDNKLYVMGEAFGLFNLRERVHSAGYNRVFRALKNAGYKIGEIGETMLNPVIMLSVLDDMRFYRGRFVSHNEFRSMEKSDPSAPDWDSLKDVSLYNSLDVIDGEMKVKSSIGELQAAEAGKAIFAANKKINFIMSNCDGILSQDEQVSLRRHYLGYFLTAHSGWMTLAMGRMLKKKGLNPDTNQVEQGYVHSYLSTLMRLINILKSGNITNIADAWRGAIDDESGNLNFNDQEKIALKRLALNGAFAAVFAILVRAMLGWDDRDKDKGEGDGALAYMQELTMYLLEGTENEFFSQNSMFGLSQNIVERVDQPIVASRLLGDITKPSNWSGKKVEQGAYKGDSKFFRMLCRNTVLRHIINFKSASDLRRTRKSWEMYNDNSTPFLFRKDKNKDKQAKKDNSIAGEAFSK